jgi:glutathione S-transferase
MELTDIGNVGANSQEIFGNNPLMKVPTLQHNDVKVFDSDNIAQYLASIYDSSDRFSVMTKDTSLLNLRCVMNGVMSAEVELILARRSGIDTDSFPRFGKHLASIENGLQWLEHHAKDFPCEPSYAAFHAVCMWDHLKLYNIVELSQYHNLAEIRNKTSELSYVKESAP